MKSSPAPLGAFDEAGIESAFPRGGVDARSVTEPRSMRPISEARPVPARSTI